MVRLLHFSFGLFLVMLMRYKPVTARQYDLTPNEEEFTGTHISGGAKDMAEGDAFSPRRRKNYKEILYDYNRVVPVFLKEQQTRRLSAEKNCAFASEGSAKTCQKELDEFSKKEIEEPIFIQKSQECIFRREPYSNGSFDYFVDTKKMDPVTHKFSNDPLRKIKELSTEDFVDEFDDRPGSFNNTFIMTFSDDKSFEGPVFAASLDSVDPPSFLYYQLFDNNPDNNEDMKVSLQLQQTPEHEAVFPLSRLFQDGKNNSQTYKDCSYFVAFDKDNAPIPLPETFKNTKFPTTNNDRLLDGYTFKAGRKPSPFQTVNKCIDPSINSGKEPCIEDVASGDVNIVYDRFISDTSERASFLSVVAKAEGGYMGGTASLSAEYASNSKMTEHSVTYTKGATRYKTNHRIRFPENLKLTSDAKKLLTTDPNGFLSVYGFFFTSSITYGATFIGSFSLNAKSAEAVQDLKVTAEVSASGGVWSASGSTEFQQKTSAKSESISTTSSFKFQGGADNGKSINEPKDLQQTFEYWNDSVEKGSTVPVYLNIEQWINSQDVQSVVLGFEKSADREKFTKQPIVLDTTTVMASTERMSTHLLIKTLEHMKEWPTINDNTDMGTRIRNERKNELDGIMTDAKKYISIMQLDFDDVQLFALQSEMLEKKNVKIGNEFETWMFYKKILSKRFDKLLAKSKKDEGSLCDADLECNSNNCYIQKCVVKIEGSIPFPAFDFALLFLSEPAYAIDAFDGNGELYAYPENRSGAQRFRAEKDGSIIHVTSNKALAVDGSTFMHGNHLKLEARDGTLAQQWVAFNNGRIANKKSGLFITFALKGKNEHNPPLTIELSPTENYYGGVAIDVRRLKFARV